MADKIIKGQAWISGDSLVQDQILLTSDGKSSENTVTLIANIWDDLTKASGNEYKTNGKGYFFWEVEMTSMEDDDTIVTINIECPKPKPGLFQEPYDPESVDSSYAKYWVAKMKTAQENYENEYAIQRKEVVFKGTTYQDQEGQDVTLPDYTFNNTDIGDITNLLSLF